MTPIRPVGTTTTAMADHEDLFATGGGLDDASLANFFGSSDGPSPAVDSSAASNHHHHHHSSHTSARPSRTSSSPAAGQAAIATTNPQSLPSGTTAVHGVSFYQTADGAWPSFDDTPPYDAYESVNPFDTFYGAGPQLSQQEWQAGGPPFALHQQQLPQRGLPPQQPGHQNHQQQQQLSPADISPIALQAEPLILPPAPTGHVRPNPAPEVLQTLTFDQQERLKNIAMPAHLQYHSPQSEPSPQSSPSDKDKGESISSPEAAEPSKTSSRKRKSSADDDDDDDDDDGQQPVKKTAHNMIEKRYRTNLNDKIAALRDSVPSLRIMSKSARGEDTTEDREELHGLTPAHKLNKATVLSKATEYIRHLEKRNNRLMQENDSMQQRINAFEKLFMAGAMNGAMNPLQQQPPTPIQFPQDAGAFMASPMPTPGGAQDPPGMIQVPDDMKRIIQAQVAAGRPYPIGPQANFQQNAAMMRQQQIQQQQQQIQQGRWGQTGPYFGKMMVGSLAGLMIVEAVRESETNNQTPDGRGLFAAPIQLINTFVSTSHFSVAGYSFSAVQLVSSLKLFLLFGSLLYAFVPALFSAAAPKPQKARQQTRASLSAVPSLASPIHVRRQAWLTAIQTVWVPRHNFILEAAALMIKTVKLSLRNIIGIQQYQALTGLTEEQEAARVKAWAIALDAQLAGGDVEINKSRLTLTLLASGTLPDTPLRLMLKALHIRVLLWQLGQRGVHNVVAAKLARAKWNQAKQALKLSKASSPASSPSSSPKLSAQAQVPPDDSLPDHLAVLLEQECDDVLNDDVVQRAHNLAWNRPTTHDVVADIDGMNAVVEDPAIKSPMDAVAAWWSSLVLHQVLTTSLGDGAATPGEDSKEEPFSSAVNEEDLALAVKVAPVGSNAQVRALVARAFLVKESRGANIVAALEAMAPSSNPDKYPAYSRVVPPLIDSPATATKAIDADPDAKMALHCAMVAAHLSSRNPKSSALELVEKILRGSTEGLTLLGFAAAFRLILRLHAHPVASETCLGSIERLAGTLRIWIGGPESDRCALSRETRQAVGQRCLAITKSAVGMDMDPGYGSMSEAGSIADERTPSTGLSSMSDDDSC